MNTNGLARHYGLLKPAERFRLILAASGRGDEAGRDRLVTSGQRITLSVPDHAPYAEALEELAPMFFVELVEDAAVYHDSFERVNESDEFDHSVGSARKKGKRKQSAADVQSKHDRLWGLVLGAGYVLRAKADGWRLFCERQGIDPYVLWSDLPGFERLQRALELAREIAFKPEGMLAWMNRIRPADEPEMTEIPLTAERVAAGTDHLFRKRVAWHGGEPAAKC
jgi:hypothetical protein